MLSATCIQCILLDVYNDISVVLLVDVHHHSVNILYLLLVYCVSICCNNRPILVRITGFFYVLRLITVSN